MSEQHALNAISSGRLTLAAPSGEQLNFKYARHIEHDSGDWTWVGVPENGKQGDQIILTFGSKAAFGSMGRLEPDMLCMDGTIPRKALPDVLDRISELSDHYGLVCCNVFHAGDGNLHPLIVFDCMSEGALERAESFGADILKLCVAMGGVLTG